MRLAELAGRAPSAAVLACYAGLDVAAPDDYRQLAALLVDEWRREGIARVGVGGGQGVGKSTLGRLIAAAGQALDTRVATLGLDDFYLTKAERQELARAVHPLLATRGPPGTHAVAELRRALAALREPVEVRVPRFDKGADDRTAWATLRGPADVVVVDGWCIGAPPAETADATPIAAPINALEREHDGDGHWRRYTEQALRGEYAKLNADFDAIVFLQVPGLPAVRRWRLQQEAERPAAQRMTESEVFRFVEHYERVTRRMLATLPNTADVVVELDDAHRVSGLRFAERR